MGRKRKHDRHFPERWWRDPRGGRKIYYIVPKERRDEEIFKGKRLYPLGDNEYEAHSTFAALVKTQNFKYDNINKCLDFFVARYVENDDPKLGRVLEPKTRRHHDLAVERIRLAFGELRIESLCANSNWIYKFFSKISEKFGPHAAKQCTKTLRAFFNLMIQQGVISNSEHPMKGLEFRVPASAAKRYIEDWEVAEWVKSCDEVRRLYTRFALMTALDKATILTLAKPDLASPGIRIVRLKNKKTGKPVIIRWTGALRSLVAEIEAYGFKGATMFSNRSGKPFFCSKGTSSAFDRNWREQMKRAIEGTRLERSFTPHDLRGKVLSDATSKTRAKELGLHKDERTTEVYRLLPELVEPADISEDILCSV